MNDDQNNALWRFSFRVYGDADVERACLRLQDDHGADVSLVLFCCWLGAAGYGRVDGARLHDVMAIAMRWSKKNVYPLRAIRRGLKSDPSPVSKERAEATRQKVLAAEIEAERALLGLLYDNIQDLTAQSVSAERRLDDARANVAAYLTAAGIAVGDVARQIETIVGTAVSVAYQRD